MHTIISVFDEENPSIVNLPTDISVNNDPTECGALITWIEPTPDDNCAGSSILQTAGPANNSLFPIGLSIVTYTSTDAIGNIHEESFTVTVNDNEAPNIIDLPADISANNDPALCGAIVTWTEPTSDDNCPGSTILQTAGLINGSEFPIGISTVTYTASDDSGNNSMGSFDVMVSDSEKPTIVDLPADISINNDPATCGAIVSWIEPTGNDNCPGSLISQTEGLAPGSLFPLGITSIVYSVTDANGNTDTGTFDVIVSDSENPTILDLPEDISVSNDANNCGALISWTEPTSNDNCPGSTIAQTAGPANGSLFPLGMSIVSYTAYDANGNSYEESFNVSISDTEDPTIDGLPSDIILSNDAGLCGAVASWIEPTSDDNCPGSTISQTAGLTSGSVFPIGPSTVTYSVLDAYGNSYEESFDVIVSDSEAPTLSAVNDFTVNPDLGCDFSIPDYTGLVSAADNCGLLSITQDPVLGTLLSGHGNTQLITLTANDENGNSTSTSFTISLLGTEVYYADTDGDGFGDPNNSVMDCSTPIGYVSNNDDCDDSSDQIYPTAIEICDGLDNNCDGTIDDGDPLITGQTAWYLDNDGDAYGNDAISILSCEQPIGYVQDNTDCDDNAFAVNPGVTEIPGNGINDDCDPATLDGDDNDGDGIVNELDPDDDNDGCLDINDPNPFVASTDQDGDGVVEDCDICLGDDATGDSDGDGVCDDLDTCIGDDSIDTDGDLIPDACDVCPLDNPDDSDGDGICDSNDICPGGDDLADADGDAIPDGCDVCLGNDASGDSDGDGICDDLDICAAGDDLVDTDADGVPNACDVCPLDNPDDSDGDGICDSNDICPGSDDLADADGDAIPDGCDVCEGNDASGDSDGDGICDDLDICAAGDDLVDTDADGVPNACDVCPLDNPDDSDGDGICDSNDICPGGDDLADADGDAIPDGCDVCLGNDASGDSDGDGICDDLDICAAGDDLVDTDADGVPNACDVCPLDNPDDSDGDGICDSNDICPGGDDLADADGDAIPDACDVCLGNDASGDSDGDGICDSNDICPGSDDLADVDGDGIPNGCDVEECDGIDNNGDGIVDEGFPDSDGDGIADCVDTGVPDNDGDGYTSDVDCDDTNPTVYPGAPELCDGLDNNCDTQVDEGLSTDADGDGHYAVGSCLSPADDCDDNDPSVYPGAPELCDAIDNDCNGIVDDGLSSDADGDGHYAIGSCLLPNDDCDDNDATFIPVLQNFVMESIIIVILKWMKDSQQMRMAMGIMQLDLA